MKRLLLPLLLLCADLPCTAQLTEADIKRTSDLVFFGLDFNFLKLIHQEGFVDKNGKPMCNTLTFKYFNEWNEMFVIEKDKFDLKRYFDVPKYTTDLAKVSERNKAYDTDACIIEDDNYRIDATQLADAVKQYGTADQMGIGCVIFVESMNKIEGKGVVYSVFFDLSDHTVLKIDRQEGSPVGQGFRNYWINAVDNALSAGSKAYRR